MKNSILYNFMIKNVVRSVSKPIISIIALFVLHLGVFANPHLASKQQIGMFKNSKTCIVLENGIGSYNFYIKDAVQKYWKSTEYEFIDQPEFEKRRHDTKYSFLVMMKSVHDNDPGGVSYNCINLVLGDPAWNMTDMPELCSLPLSYANDPETDLEYVIPSVIKFIQKHAQNLEKNRFLISLNGLKYYNRSIGFKDKVLLLNKSGMATNADSPQKINTVYPYYVKLLSTSEINEELSTGQKNILLQFHVGPSLNTAVGKCFEMIFDVDGNLYYYSSRMVTNDNEDGFNLDDFKRIR